MVTDLLFKSPLLKCNDTVSFKQVGLKFWLVEHPWILIQFWNFDLGSLKDRSWGCKFVMVFFKVTFWLNTRFWSIPSTSCLDSFNFIINLVFLFHIKLLYLQVLIQIRVSFSRVVASLVFTSMVFGPVQLTFSPLVFKLTLVELPWIHFSSIQWANFVPSVMVQRCFLTTGSPKSKVKLSSSYSKKFQFTILTSKLYFRDLKLKIDSEYLIDRSKNIRRKS